jgi:hypothetical protein
LISDLEVGKEVRDHLDQQDHQVHKDLLDLRVILVLLDHKELLVHKD